MKNSDTLIGPLFPLGSMKAEFILGANPWKTPMKKAPKKTITSTELDAELTRVEGDNATFKPVSDLESAIGQQRNHVWTLKEEQLLLRYYGRVPTKSLCAHLGLSYPKVKNKAQSMGLQGRDKR